MSNLVGEATIIVRTETEPGSVSKEGRRAGEGYKHGFLGSVKGMAAGIVGFLALEKLYEFTKQSVEVARESQKAQAATAQLVKVTGGAARVSADEVKEYSEALARKIGVDHSVIQSSANTVLAFKNIRDEVGKGNDVFEQTIGLGQDLAADGLGSPTSATKALAKALNDPIKGMTALGRIGVTFTAQQQEQIKALVATGNVLGAQKILLDEVRGKVGGLAAATASNADKSKAAFTEVKDAVGSGLLPVLDAVEGAFANKVAPAIIDTVKGTNVLGGAVRTMAHYFREAVGVVEDLFDGSSHRAKHAAIDIDAALGGDGKYVASIRKVAREILRGFGDIERGVKSSIKAALPVVKDLARVLAKDLGQAVENLLPIFAPLVKEALHLASSFRLGELKGVSGILKGIGDVLVKVTGFMAKHAGTVRGIVVALVAMAAAYQAIAIIIGVVETVTAAYIVVQEALDVVMDANPIGLLVVALAGLAAGLLYAYKHSARFKAIVDALGHAISAFISGALAFVKAHWPLLIALLGGPIAVVVYEIVHHFGAIKDAVSDAFHFIARLPDRILSAIGSKMKSVGKSIIHLFFQGLSAEGSFIGKLGDAVKDAAIGAINAVIDLLNKAIPNKIAIPGAPDINLPDNPIPHLARGTSSFRGGYALVGEEGPELVSLPRGTGVTPAAQTAAALGGPSISIGTVMPHDYHTFVRQMTEQNRAATMGGVALGRRLTAVGA